MAGRLASRGLGQLLARRALQAPKIQKPLRGGHGGHDTRVRADPAIYGDLKLPHVSQGHKNVARAMGTFLWFWVFYRAYYDLPALLGHHAFHDEHDDDDDHH